MFSGQWAVGLVLNQWPQTASGYAPEAYPWALGGLWRAGASSPGSGAAAPAKAC